MSIWSRLKEAMDVIAGKRSPFVSGCGKLDGKCYSAVFGQISEAEYAEWEWAMGVIAETMNYLRTPGTSKVLSGKKLDDFRRARTIENRHKPR